MTIRVSAKRHTFLRSALFVAIAVIGLLTVSAALLSPSASAAVYSQYFNDNSIGGWSNTTVAPNTGSVTVAGGQMTIAAPLNTDVHVVDTNSASYSDGVLAFSVVPGVGRIGGMFRYNSESSFVWVGYEYSATASHWRIREAGHLERDITFTDPEVLDGSASYNVKIKYEGNQLSVWLNDRPIYTGTLASMTTLGAGKVGVVVWSDGHASFDNVHQQDLLAPPPAGKQEITNGTVTVTLDKGFPQPLGYKLNATGAVLHGADGYPAPQININGVDYTASVTGFTGASDSAAYEISVPGFNVTLNYAFTLEGHSLVRRLTAVGGTGEPNVKTIRITSPVIKVAGDQSGASAAFYSGGAPGRGGGYDVIGVLGDHNPTYQSTPWAFVYGGGAVGASYNNLLITPSIVEVAGSGSSRTGAIYDSEYNYRYQSIKPGVWFQSKTYIGGDSNGSGAADWQDGAIWVRSQLPQMPAALSSFYSNGGNWNQTNVSFIREAGVASSYSSNIMTSYPLLAAQQRQIYYETDGLAQQSYEAAGWQYRGHDWNWPDWIQEVNPGLGGRTEMDRARVELGKYNSDLSFHVNADDMTELSASYQSIPNIRAKYANGSPKLSYDSSVFGFNAWSINHFKDLTNGTALARIDSFVNQFWAPKIVYQDVMLPVPSEDSGYGMNEEMYAMKAEVDRWADHGVYVTTEYYSPEKRRNGGFQFKRYATNSIIDHFINAGTTIFQNNFYGGEVNSGDPGEDYDKLFAYMVSGRDRSGNFIGTQNFMAANVIKDTYLLNLMNSYMRNRSAQAFVGDASKYEMRWGSDLLASYDKASGTFTLKQGDLLLATGSDRFIPAPNGESRIYVYSLKGSARVWKLPTSWAAVTKVNRYELTNAGRAFVDSIDVAGGAVALASDPMTPYVLEPGSGFLPAAGPVNLAAGHTATASSATGIDGAANAVDGSSATKWTAASGDSAPWLAVEFARETTINRAAISEVGAKVSSYAIQYWDGSAWITAGTGSSIGAGLSKTLPEFRTTKVRLLISGTASQPAIAELMLYADQNLALLASATASSNGGQDASRYTDVTSFQVGTASGGFTYKFDVQAARAMDGADATYWSASGETNGAWLAADLRRPTTVNRFVLSEQGNRVTGYRIQQWNGSAWLDLYAGTTIGSYAEVNVPAVTASRFRLLVDSASGTPAIREFAIYRTGGVRTPQPALTVADLSGSGNTVMASGAFLHGSGCPSGDCLATNASSLVEAADAASLNVTGAITLEAWIYKPSDAPNDYKRIIDKSVVNTSNGYMMDVTNTDKLRFVGGGDPPFIGTTTIPRDQWVHVAAVFEGGTAKTIKLYVNGVLDASGSRLTNLTLTTSKLHIGSDNLLGSNWIGKLDEVRIYSRALSGAEVAADKSFNYTSTGLVAYYSF